MSGTIVLPVWALLAFVAAVAVRSLVDWLEVRSLRREVALWRAMVVRRDTGTLRLVRGGGGDGGAA